MRGSTGLLQETQGAGAMKGTLTKAVTVSLVIIVLALAFLATFQGSQLYQSQKKASELQKQVTSYENMMNTPPNVTITDISSGDWYFQEHYGPPPYYKPFNVTFENLGPMSIGGITIKYKVEGNPTNIGDDFLIFFTIHFNIEEALERNPSRQKLNGINS